MANTLDREAGSAPGLMPETEVVDGGVIPPLGHATGPRGQADEVATPEPIQEIVPEVAPEVGPEISPEVGPEIFPEISPEVGPETGPELGPETGPETGPEEA